MNLLHRAVVSIRNVDIPARVHGHAEGRTKAAAQRVDRRAAVDRAHGRTSCARHNLLHRIVVRIRDEDIPARVHRHAKGLAEAAAAHRVDRRAGVDLAHRRTSRACHDLVHRTVVKIRDEDIPARVHRHAIGIAKAAAHRVDRRFAVDRAHRRTSRARHDLLHRKVARIRNENIPARVHRHASGTAEAAAHRVDR